MNERRLKDTIMNVVTQELLSHGFRSSDKFFQNLEKRVEEAIKKETESKFEEPID